MVYRRQLRGAIRVMQKVGITEPARVFDLLV